MTDTQLHIAIGLPMLFNGVLITFFLLYMNARFDAASARFTSIDRHLDSLEKIWDEKLARVEGVMDARLKHLKER